MPIFKRREEKRETPEKETKGIADAKAVMDIETELAKVQRTNVELRDDRRINGYIDDSKKVKLRGAGSPEEAISLALDEGKHGQRLSRSTKH